MYIEYLYIYNLLDSFYDFFKILDKTVFVSYNIVHWLEQTLH